MKCSSGVVWKKNLERLKKLVMQLRSKKYNRPNLCVESKNINTLIGLAVYATFIDITLNLYSYKRKCSSFNV